MIDGKRRLGGVEQVDGGVCAPRGFRASGVYTGVKRRRKDLSMLVSDVPAHVAATFTTNRVKAAPLVVTREHLHRSGGRLQALVVNSGNANACNGPRGLRDARRMVREAAEVLGLEPSRVGVGSTGVIGLPLDMERIVPGIRAAAQELSPGGFDAAAEGIMTTDLVPKRVAVKFDMEGIPVRLGGMAKGSGMIHPNMATMFAFITTDAVIDPDLLAEVHRDSVKRSYNMISVDGDTSTNDMTLLFSNGRAGNAEIGTGSGAALERFREALDWVNLSLAKAIVRDGEGARKLVEIRVEGAGSTDAARLIARSVAGSNLVKTAVFGGDPNWGRVLCAAGYSGAEFDPDRVDLFMGDEGGRPHGIPGATERDDRGGPDMGTERHETIEPGDPDDSGDPDEVQVARDGAALPFDEARANRILSAPESIIRIVLHEGGGVATAWTCDLSYEYVRINGSYRS